MYIVTIILCEVGLYCCEYPLNDPRAAIFLWFVTSIFTVIFLTKAATWCKNPPTSQLARSLYYEDHSARDKYKPEYRKRMASSIIHLLAYSWCQDQRCTVETMLQQFETMSQQCCNAVLKIGVANRQLCNNTFNLFQYTLS